MSVSKRTATKSGQPPLGMTRMGHGPSRTASRGAIASGADDQLHQPVPTRPYATNPFASRSNTIASASGTSSKDSETTVTNIEPVSFNPLPLGAFVNSGEQATTMAHPPRSKSRAEIRSEPTHDSQSPLPTELRRAKTPAPGRAQADIRIHPASTVTARLITDFSASKPSDAPISHNAEVTVDNAEYMRAIPFQPPPPAFGWVARGQKEKARQRAPQPAPPARAQSPPTNNRSHTNDHTDNTLIAEEHGDDYIVPLSEKANGKPPLERRANDDQSREHLRESALDTRRKRGFSPVQRQSAEPPVLRTLPTDQRLRSRAVFEEDGAMGFYTDDSPNDERPSKRGRTDNRNVASNPRGSPLSALRQLSPYDEYDQQRHLRSPAPHPGPAYWDYQSQDGYDAVPEPSLPDSDRIPYPSTSPAPQPKNLYDTDVYLNQHVDKFERMKQRWCECSHEEWVQGGPELLKQFEAVLAFVKDKMQEKIDLYSNLHSNLNAHDKTLDDRDLRLQEVQGTLANGTSTIVGSRERPIVL